MPDNDEKKEDVLKKQYDDLIEELRALEKPVSNYITRKKENPGKMQQFGIGIAKVHMRLKKIFQNNNALPPEIGGKIFYEKFNLDRKQTSSATNVITAIDSKIYFLNRKSTFQHKTQEKFKTDQKKAYTDILTSIEDNLPKAKKSKELSESLEAIKAHIESSSTRNMSLDSTNASISMRSLTRTPTSSISEGDNNPDTESPTLTERRPAIMFSDQLRQQKRDSKTQQSKRNSRRINRP